MLEINLESGHTLKSILQGDLGHDMAALESFEQALNSLKTFHSDELQASLESSTDSTLYRDIINFLSRSIKSPCSCNEETTALANKVFQILKLELFNKLTLAHCTMKYGHERMNQAIALIVECDQLLPAETMPFLLLGANLNASVMALAMQFGGVNAVTALLNLYQQKVMAIIEEDAIEAYDILNQQCKWIKSTIWHLLAHNTENGFTGLSHFIDLVQALTNTDIDQDLLLELVIQADKINWHKGPQKKVSIEKSRSSSTGWNILQLCLRYQEENTCIRFINFLRELNVYYECADFLLYALHNQTTKGWNALHMAAVFQDTPVMMALLDALIDTVDESNLDRIYDLLNQKTCNEKLLFGHSWNVGDLIAKQRVPQLMEKYIDLLDKMNDIALQQEHGNPQQIPLIHRKHLVLILIHQQNWHALGRLVQCGLLADSNRQLLKKHKQAMIHSFKLLSQTKKIEIVEQSLDLSTPLGQFFANEKHDEIDNKLKDSLLNILKAPPSYRLFVPESVGELEHKCEDNVIEAQL